MKSLKSFKPAVATTLAIVVGWLLTVRPAEAGYTVTLQQVGPDVVATGSGAIYLTGLIHAGYLTYGWGPGVLPGAADDGWGGVIAGRISTGPTIAGSVDSYHLGPSGPTSFGSGGGAAASSGSGDTVGTEADCSKDGSDCDRFLIVPRGYVSGTFLSNSATYSGKTFATLGVTPGTYIWKWGTGANQNFTLQIPPFPPLATNITNLSTRGLVQTGPDVLIGGFIISGQPQQVLIRALGPTLTQFGVPNVLANPQLTLYNQEDPPQPIASNDNWQTTVVDGTVITGNQSMAIQGTRKAPPAANESAILATLAPGNYTTIVSGVSGTTGAGLVEVYGLGSGTAATSLSNISTRGLVQTGANIMIGGFIVSGQPQKVLIRALGPTLTQFEVPNPLANPQLTLFNEAHQPIASNDNWQTTIVDGTIITSNQVAEIQDSGKAPPSANEPAILATLAPGNYTAQVSGVNGATGTGLVEVYMLP